MKKILLYVIVMSSFLMKAQSLSYTDAAVLFSTDDNYGTARYMGLSGAFGALGGDMSAVNINPAGLAVFNKPEISMTLGIRDSQYNTRFHGTTLNNRDNYFKLSQIGGVFFLKNYENSDFKKVMFGVNYSVIKDFDNSYTAEGNSGIGEFINDPFLNSDNNDTNDINYINVENQFFGNFTSGVNSQFTFSLASQYGDLLYLGASISFKHLDFNQKTIFDELNNDGNGNTLDAYSSEYLSIYGSGFNFGLGAILKPVQNLRLGLSYQSPVWYNLSDEFDKELEIEVSNSSQTYIEDSDLNRFDYEMKTPSKLTGSVAYVFGKSGLISLDYIYQNYRSTKLKPLDTFLNENQELA
ncbi:MAG: outer membrane protein transport protein, partial [Flavobacteriaceae bacterium]|nr:outer membrane protein transport protein [Flavobacteriaceae bacterium]